MPVENNAPIAAVMKMIDDSLLTGISAAAGAISNIVTPIAAACFGIYMILLAMNYARGASSKPVVDFWVKMIGLSIIISLGLKMENYTFHVIPIVLESGSDLAAAVSGDAPRLDITTLDEMIQDYARILFDDINQLETRSSANGNFIIFFIKILLILIAILPFVVFVAALLIVAKAGAALALAVGPLFFACLVFPATRQYFLAWVNAVVFYALLPVFVAIIAVMSVELSQTLFSVQDGVKYMTFVDVFMAAIVNLLLICLLKTCRSLALALSAGGLSIGFNVGGAYGNARNAAAGTTIINNTGIHARQKTAVFGANVAATMQNMTRSGIKPG
jgi:type IV secretion system protein VirB6